MTRAKGAWQTQGRLKCDELLGKYLGMWTDKVEVTAIDELSERLKKAREQAGIVPEISRSPALLEAAPPSTEINTEEPDIPLPTEEEPPPAEPEDWVERLLR